VTFGLGNHCSILLSYGTAPSARSMICSEPGGGTQPAQVAAPAVGDPIL
jgi:hypothetical protein